MTKPKQDHTIEHLITTEELLDVLEFPFGEQLFFAVMVEAELMDWLESTYERRGFITPEGAFYGRNHRVAGADDRFIPLWYKSKVYDLNDVLCNYC